MACKESRGLMYTGTSANAGSGGRRNHGGLDGIPPDIGGWLGMFVFVQGTVVLHLTVGGDRWRSSHSLGC